MSEDNLESTKISSRLDYEKAIGTVIASAEKSLHIFDNDLSTGAYNSVECYDVLRKFLLKDRNNRLVIVLHEINYLTRDCPRLIQLLKLFSHAISIFQTQEHGRVASDSLVVADRLHYVHRFHTGSPRANLALNDPAKAQQLEERFEQLLETSVPAVFPTTLGL